MANKSQTDSNIDFIGTDDDWETVVEESGRKITFEQPGDSFVGVYVGTTTIEQTGFEKDGTPKQAFDQQRFRDTEGNLWAINGGHKLREGLQAVEEGEIVRIVYMGDIDTGQPSPMKDFRVDRKKSGANTKASTKEAVATEDIQAA